MRTLPLLPGEVAEMPRRRRPAMFAVGVAIGALSGLGAVTLIGLAAVLGHLIAGWLS